MAEIKCWTVAVGNAPMPWSSRKVKRAADEAVKIIRTLEGLVGVYPDYPRGTLLLFGSENDAKRAKNLLDAKRIHTGYNIGEVFVDEAYFAKERKRP